MYLAAQVFICLRPTPLLCHALPPPPLTHCIRVYSILIHTGKEGREERANQGEGYNY
jgi:hypothetical protein